ncbi:MAG TPA: protein kinase [Bryobacteraceae bacterium]|nr:protein kinase [Bryobacteraceae bacterium]
MPLPERIGRYQVLRKLGEGGMGVVYAAQDERLSRPVALKTIREARSDEQSRKRLWREARAAAAVNHPNVCQIYEIGEEDGELFLTMELLEGEPLSHTLERGPVAVSEAAQLMLGVLAALEALHRRQIVHGDLKPSNIFQTAHGVKLLDFGLARPAQPISELKTETDWTLTHGVAGTPHYMSPEQFKGDAPDTRSDIFSAGAILFEMLAGRRAFAGQSVAELFHAILYEQPPALAGSSAISAVDRVIHRALAKKPADRYQTADLMAQDLRMALLVSDSAAPAHARPMTRLIVLPFRILRPDAETDFLAFSLPDAITGSLSGLESLVVRSSIVASRFADPSIDLKTIVAEAEVDIVLTGTLLRAGDQIRVSTQLVEAPAGTLVWSHTSQLPLQDILSLQDDLVRRVVESVAPSLSAREQRMLRHDVPATAKAYEFFLRANQLSQRTEDWKLARDLYLQCVEQDPEFAPAWARLGRCYRVLGKFGVEPAENLERAEAAFQRALTINPDLPLAHTLYAQIEAERGKAQEAMTRLIQRARTLSNDPELFAGLVHACRYCGLLEPSIAAHQRARRLDPNIPTSVSFTYFAMGDYPAALAACSNNSDYAFINALAGTGREREAEAVLKEWDSKDLLPINQLFRKALGALFEGRKEECIEATMQVIALFTDPEGIFYMVRQLAYFGEADKSLSILRRAVEGGFYCFPVLARDPWLDPLRGNPEFASILRLAERHSEEALTAFHKAGGNHVLALERN